MNTPAFSKSLYEEHIPKTVKEDKLTLALGSVTGRSVYLSMNSGKNEWPA
jgi:hypothetical protein